MMLLVAIPFAVLIIAVLAMRMMTGLRLADEIRSSRLPLGADSTRRRPSDDYHDGIWLPLCTRFAEAARARLNRPLTRKERRTIWRTRSAMVLEVVVKEVEAAPDSQTVCSILAGLPTGMDRPDPTAWMQRDSDP